MSMTIIAKLLNPDYDYGCDFSPKILKSVTKTPSQRVQEVILGAQRYYSGSVNYSPMLGADYLDFRNLWDTCIQTGSGCLFWDHKENQITDQSLGLGDGSNRLFQLHKQSSTGAVSVYRTITRPVDGYTGSELPDGLTLSSLAVTVKVAGVDQTGLFDVDNTTGVITFHTGHAPGIGLDVTASCYFFVPIWFPTSSLENEQSGSNYYVKNLMIEEVVPF